MDLFDVSGREKRSTFVKVLIACVLAAILAPPLAHAATTQVRGTVKIKDSGNGTVNASPVGTMGLFEAAGSTGALDVRTFGGGGGVLGAANCNPADDAVGLTDTVAVTDSIVTGIMVTGTDATFTATAQAFGNHALPLLNFSVDDTESNVFVGLGNGLTITTELRLKCTAGTNGNLVVFGQ